MSAVPAFPKPSRRYLHPKTGYAFVRVKGHPRADSKGDVLEHIVVAERAIGRYLVEPNCVHHVDHDRSNNENSNLVICEDQTYHLLLHRRERIVQKGGNPNKDRICSRCDVLIVGHSFGEYGSLCRDCYDAWRGERAAYAARWRRATGRAVRRYRPNLTAEEESGILRMADSGIATKDIASYFSVRSSAIRWVKKRNGRHVPSREELRLTHCARGHLIETTESGRRVCRPCRAEAQRQYLNRKRGQK